MSSTLFLSVVYEEPAEVPEVLKKQDAMLSTCLVMKKIGGEDFWQINVDRVIAIAARASSASPGSGSGSASSSRMTSIVVADAPMHSSGSPAAIRAWAEKWNTSKMSTASRIHALKAMRIIMEVSLLSPNEEYGLIENAVKSILRKLLSHAEAPVQFMQPLCIVNAALVADLASAPSSASLDTESFCEILDNLMRVIRNTTHARSFGTGEALQLDVADAYQLRVHLYAAVLHLIQGSRRLYQKALRVCDAISEHEFLKVTEGAGEDNALTKELGIMTNVDGFSVGELRRRATQTLDLFEKEDTGDTFMQLLVTDCTTGDNMLSHTVALSMLDLLVPCDRSSSWLNMFRRSMALQCFVANTVGWVADGGTDENDSRFGLYSSRMSVLIHIAQCSREGALAVCECGAMEILGSANAIPILYERYDYDAPAHVSTNGTFSPADKRHTLALPSSAS